MSGTNSLIKDSGLLTSSQTSVLTRNYGSSLNNTYVDTFERRFKLGSAIGNFHKRKNRGDLLPHTSFTQVEHSGGWISGHYTWTDIEGALSGQTATWSIWEGHEGPYDYRCRDFDTGQKMSGFFARPDMSQTQYFVQQAASRIIAQGWDGLTFAAELPKLRKQFIGVSRRLSQLMERGNLKSVTSKRALKLWLEGRYGWRTLAYDIRDLYQAVVEFDAQREIYSERAGTSYTDVTTYPAVEVSVSAAFTTTLSGSMTRRYSLRGAVSARISPRRLDLSLLQTGWELLPLSFVVDWVYGVGVALDTYRFLQASAEHTCSVGFQEDYTMDMSMNGVANTGYTGSCNAQYLYTGTCQVRQPTEISLKPQLTSRALTPDLALDIQALARVLFSKG